MNGVKTAESRLSEGFRDFVKLRGLLIEWAAALHAKSWRIGAQLQSKQIVATDGVECSLRFVKSQLHKACDFPALMVLRCDAMRCDGRTMRSDRESDRC